MAYLVVQALHVLVKELGLSPLQKHVSNYPTNKDHDCRSHSCMLSFVSMYSFRIYLDWCHLILVKILFVLPPSITVQPRHFFQLSGQFNIRTILRWQDYLASTEYIFKTDDPVWHLPAFYEFSIPIVCVIGRQGIGGHTPLHSDTVKAWDENKLVTITLHHYTARR